MQATHMYAARTYFFIVFACNLQNIRTLVDLVINFR
jgi:hypothetical protein